MDPLTLLDFEPLARERLDAGAYAYFAGGAGAEITLRANEEAFARRRLLPRVLVDVSTIDTATTILGTPVAMPIGICPMALQGLAHPDGEVATARAAAKAGLIFTASTVASRTLEDIPAAGDGPRGGVRWFQLYANRDRGITERLIDRAREAGYAAIVLTVDVPTGGVRQREARAGWEYPAATVGNFLAMSSSRDDLLRILEGHPSDALTWADLSWIRQRARLPLVVKGILTADDARLAVEHGAAAVWVSNHGGRQLDRTPPAIDALEEVVDAVGGRAEVYLDSGVRRGVDVVTAVALGARAVFVGRPILYALAWNGEAGVAHALSLLKDEIENTMALLGTPTIAAISRAHVA